MLVISARLRPQPPSPEMTALFAFRHRRVRAVRADAITVYPGTPIGGCLGTKASSLNLRRNVTVSRASIWITAPGESLLLEFVGPLRTEQGAAALLQGYGPNARWLHASERSAAGGARYVNAPGWRGQDLGTPGRSGPAGSGVQGSGAKVPRGAHSRVIKLRRISEARADDQARAQDPTEA